MVVDDGNRVLVASALLWASRFLERATNPPPHSDVADMRLLLELLKDALPAGMLQWSDLPSGEWQ